MKDQDEPQQKFSFAIAMNPVAAAAASPAVGAKKPSTEQKNSNPNPRASRWSDAPPNNEATEPPQKKVKNDAPSLGNTVEAAVTVGHGNSVTETPPSLAYTQSASATTAISSYGVSEHGTMGYGQGTGYQSYGSQYQTLPPVHGSFAPGSAKGTGALFYKTKLCTKFKIGACTFNERCHFAHGTEDLRKPPPLWESMTGGVASGSSASSGSFMGQTRPKTRPCRYFADGNCPYGDRCNFLHGNEEPQIMQGMVGGSYGATGAAVAAAQPQGYSGVSAYPNGGNASTNMQYAYPNQGALVTPTNYANSSSMNSAVPPAPYGGAPVDYTAGVVGHVAAPGMVPYGNVPATTNATNPYPASQDGTNGASMNYASWNGPPVASNPTPGYMHTSQTGDQGYQTASWMHNYAAGAYPKAPNETAIPSYPQEQSQQHQNMGTAAPYTQGVPQNIQQGGPALGDGNYYQTAYNGSSYQNQQADYTARYNMAEAWGGKSQ